MKLFLKLQVILIFPHIRAFIFSSNRMLGLGNPKLPIFPNKFTRKVLTTSSKTQAQSVTHGWLDRVFLWAFFNLIDSTILGFQANES